MNFHWESLALQPIPASFIVLCWDFQTRPKKLHDLVWYYIASKQDHEVYIGIRVRVYSSLDRQLIQLHSN